MSCLSNVSGDHGEKRASFFPVTSVWVGKVTKPNLFSSISRQPNGSFTKLVLHCWGAKWKIVLLPGRFAFRMDPPLICCHGRNSAAAALTRGEPRTIQHDAMATRRLIERKILPVCISWEVNSISCVWVAGNGTGERFIIDVEWSVFIGMRRAFMGLSVSVKWIHLEPE